MHAQDLVVDQGSDRHAVEYILEFFPDTDRVATFAFIVESIDAVDLTALVITSQQEEVLLELDLVREEQNDSLKGVLSAINVISEEQVIGLRGEAAIFKQPQQV